MTIHPSTLTDAEAIRIAYAELPKGLNKDWQVEIVRRLEKYVYASDSAPVYTKYKELAA